LLIPALQIAILTTMNYETSHCASTRRATCLIKDCHTCTNIPNVLQINSHPSSPLYCSSATPLTAAVYTMVSRLPIDTTRLFHFLIGDALEKNLLNTRVYTDKYRCFCAQNTTLHWCRVYQKNSVGYTHNLENWALIYVQNYPGIENSFPFILE
jgi:hypothetical protein